ncbi:hypothetical protein L4D09_00135 [Photobacterium makurazakiensis]|uniref:hypothetical protein n=1 Tax=Photobacterium makurazakiensis TaxID=2910234 RepID=UPI003D12FC4E
MTNFKPLLISCFAALITTSVVAEQKESEILELLVTPYNLKLSEGETYQMRANAFYADGRYVTNVEGVKWRSSDNSAVSATEDGVIFAAKNGVSSIYGTLDGHESTDPATITVGDSSIEKMAISIHNTNLIVGQTVDVEVNATFTNGDERNITDSVVWQRVTNDDAFSVEGSKLTGTNAGYGYLIAHFDGKKSDSVQIQVNDSGYLDLMVSPGATTMAVGSTITPSIRAFTSSGMVTIDAKDATYEMEGRGIVATNTDGSLRAIGKGIEYVYAIAGNVRSSQPITITVE